MRAVYAEEAWIFGFPLKLVEVQGSLRASGAFKRSRKPAAIACVIIFRNSSSSCASYIYALVFSVFSQEFSVIYNDQVGFGLEAFAVLEVMCWQLWLGPRSS